MGRRKYRVRSKPVSYCEGFCLGERLREFSRELPFTFKYFLGYSLFIGVFVFLYFLSWVSALMNYFMYGVWFPSWGVTYRGNLVLSSGMIIGLIIGVIIAGVEREGRYGGIGDQEENH